MKVLLVGLFAVLLTTGCAGEFDLDAITGKKSSEDVVETAGSRTVVNKRTADTMVKQAYRSYLFREADSGGLKFWSGLVQQGKLSREELNTTFIDSVEAYAVRLWVCVNYYLNYCNERQVPEEKKEFASNDFNFYYLQAKRDGTKQQRAVEILRMDERSEIIKMINRGTSPSVVERYIMNQLLNERGGQ